MTANQLTADSFPVDPADAAAVTDRLLRGVDAIAEAEPPTLVFIGGQPGSGKSRTVSARATSLGAAVVVDSDELRKLHPRIRDIAEADSLRMDVLSNGPVPAWTRTLIDAARERRRNVIIENTFARPEAMIDEAGRFRDAGYRVVADAIITAPAASRLGIVDRYRRAADAGEIARWTTENAHTTAVDNIAGTIDELLRSGAVELVNMHTRSGPLGIAVTSPGDAVGIIDDIRSRYPSADEYAHHRQRYEVCAGFIVDHHLVSDYSARLIGNLADDAEQVLGGNVPDSHHRLRQVLADHDARTQEAAIAGAAARLDMRLQPDAAAPLEQAIRSDPTTAADEPHHINDNPHQPEA